jgi:hypothetical protein
MKRVLTRDPLTGITTYFHHDPLEKKITLHDEQDVTAIVEHNKALQKESIDKKSDLWPVASVPYVILMQWAKEAGLELNSKEFGEVVKKKLNDPDNRAFRTQVFSL